MHLITCHSSQQIAIQTIDTDCLVWLGSEPLSKRSFSLLPALFSAFLGKVIQDEEFRFQSNRSLTLYRPPGLLAKRLMLVGIESNNPRASAQSVFTAVSAKLPHGQVKKLTLVFPDGLFSQISDNQLDSESEEDLTTWVTTFARHFYHESYRFQGYQRTPTHNHMADIALSFHLPVTPSALSQLDIHLQQELALAQGMHKARDLCHMPANMCNPDYLADVALACATEYPSVTTQILDQTELEKLGMNAYLAVNKGSSFAASMPVIHYRGDTSGDSAPVVLIGKGVTFDSGGISLKRGRDMHHMIFDMGGAASVIGIIHTIARLKLNLNVVAILATADNSIDGAAYRPGDIITTHSGLTVEVLSTDAEGRLLMSDVLSYCRRFQPSAVVDIATLTGGAIVALGHVSSALMSNHSTLEQALVDASEQANDPAWAFPLWPEYQAAIDSSHADITNTGRNSPGMITAGCFLSRFADGLKWAHLDVAGTAFTHGKSNSATGRPMPLLFHFLKHLAKDKNHLNS